MEFLQVIQ
ncbi:hypothetical protein pdam_00025730 [Pocillopora damicornis]|uniref:Uncharacterized protein n=1 Tax=Pocillopora damicornis TaxID=46731 RepID=A0A3M6T800_POCDA|nr:hypothetical protein pdam_00025730 [Pocillopora damicornis]